MTGRMQARSYRGRLLPALLLLLSGCAAIPDHVRELPADASLDLDGTPFFPQERFQCGPAALTTVLVASGANVSLDAVVDQVYLPGREGSLQIELRAAARTHGRIPYTIDGSLAAVLAEIEAGRPVLVLQNLGVAALPRWHYAVVTGIDVPNDAVILRSGTDRRRVTRTDTFLRTWRRSDFWGLVVLRPDELPAIVDRGRYFAAIAALEEVGEMESAATAWRTAATRWPDDRTARFGIANTDFALGSLDDAAEELRHLLAEDEMFIAARNNLALVLAHLGDFDAAAAEVETAMRHNPDAALDEVLRNTAMQIQRMKAASLAK
jgi:tetratricopeptide (TPR) repeat protein